MSKEIKRKQFIKLSLLGSAGIYLNSCGVGNNKTNKAADVATGSIPKDTTSIKPPVKIIEPTFKLFKNGDAPYDVLRKGFNKRIDNYPAAIAQCTTTEEAAQAVVYGIQNKLPISIKSGGHSFEGFSYNNNSLVIDLSLMNNVTWENENLISVQPGCRLSQLYDAILPKNKILPAGSCGSVGIGGLTLGGGYGLFSRKYGLTCDSLQEVTMIDGTGNMINSKDDPELLWACKGGGNGNFGVITSMKFSLNDAPDFLQSYRFRIKSVGVQRAKDVLEKWFEITSNLPLSCFSAYVLNGNSLYILLTNCEPKNNDTQKVVSDLSALVDNTSIGKPTQLSKAVEVFYGEKNPVYFKNASAGLYKNYEDIKDCIENVLGKVTSTSRMIYQVNTLGGKIDDAELSAQSSYAHRGQNYLSELQTYWQQTSQVGKMVETFEEVQQIFYTGGVRQQYRNYPDINLKDWTSAYYGKNYSRLQTVKMKYDPENVFRYEQSVEGK